jgi:hypoxanthine phosphoribosyltransferase
MTLKRKFSAIVEDDVLKKLFDNDELSAKCKEMGALLSRDYEGKEPIVVGVLAGAAVFMSDLVRCITIPVELDFISVSSYGQNATSSGSLKWKKDTSIDLTDRHVIIVEDIVDTGRTLEAVSKEFKDRGAGSVEICTLLDKQARRVADVKCKYVGFDCPDEFVIGYGIDYAEHYRNLPYVAALKRSVYE